MIKQYAFFFTTAIILARSFHCAFSFSPTARFHGLRAKHLRASRDIGDLIVDALEEAVTKVEPVHAKERLQTLMGSVVVEQDALAAWSRSTRALAMRLGSGVGWHVDLYILQPGCSLPFPDSQAQNINLLACCIAGEVDVVEGGKVSSTLREPIVFSPGPEQIITASTFIINEASEQTSIGFSSATNSSGSRSCAVLEVCWVSTAAADATSVTGREQRYAPGSLNLGELPLGSINAILKHRAEVQRQSSGLGFAAETFETRHEHVIDPPRELLSPETTEKSSAPHTLELKSESSLSEEATDSSSATHTPGSKSESSPSEETTDSSSAPHTPGSKSGSSPSEETTDSSSAPHTPGSKSESSPSEETTDSSSAPHTPGSKSESSPFEEATDSSSASYPLDSSAQYFLSSYFSNLAGVDAELKEIRGRVVIPLLAPKEIMDNLGTSPPAGVILHGPYGCGKSIMASALALCLGSTPPVIVHSLATEESVAKFQENVLNPTAVGTCYKLRTHRSTSPRVVIIENLDELPRKAVVDIFSKFDQIASESSGNSPLLLVGLTSRLDFVEPALIRPGRFEVTIQLKNPDLISRAEILRLHCKTMRSSGRLEVATSEAAFGQWLSDMALKTAGFSSAALAGVVKAAAANSLERTYSAACLKNNTTGDAALAAGGGPGEFLLPVSLFQECCVTALDFEKALSGALLNNQRALQPAKVDVGTKDSSGPSGFVQEKTISPNYGLTTELPILFSSEVEKGIEPTGWNQWDQDAVKSNIRRKSEPESEKETFSPLLHLEEPANMVTSQTSQVNVHVSPQERTKAVDANTEPKRAAVESALSDVKQRMSTTGWFHWSEESVKTVVEKRKRAAEDNAQNTKVSSSKGGLFRPPSPKPKAVNESEKETVFPLLHLKEPGNLETPQTSQVNFQESSQEGTKAVDANTEPKRAAVKLALSDVKQRMSTTGWFHWSEESVKTVVEKRKRAAEDNHTEASSKGDLFRPPSAKPKAVNAFTQAVDQIRKEEPQ